MLHFLVHPVWYEDIWIAKLVLCWWLPQHSPQPDRQRAKQYWKSEEEKMNRLPHRILDVIIILDFLDGGLSPKTAMKKVGLWSYSSNKAIETNAAQKQSSLGMRCICSKGFHMLTTNVGAHKFLCGRLIIICVLPGQAGDVCICQAKYLERTN